jgi:hypothetical protein
MFPLQHGLVLAALALFCAASVAQARSLTGDSNGDSGINCDISRDLYWPNIKKARDCSGAGSIWAFNTCWKGPLPTNKDNLCPAGCRFAATGKDASQAHCDRIPGEQLRCSALVASASQPLLHSSGLRNLT